MSKFEYFLINITFVLDYLCLIDKSNSYITTTSEENIV